MRRALVAALAVLLSIAPDIHAQRGRPRDPAIQAANELIAALQDIRPHIRRSALERLEAVSAQDETWREAFQLQLRSDFWRCRPDPEVLRAIGRAYVRCGADVAEMLARGRDARGIRLDPPTLEWLAWCDEARALLLVRQELAHGDRRSWAFRVLADHCDGVHSLRDELDCAGPLDPGIVATAIEAARRIATPRAAADALQRMASATWMETPVSHRIVDLAVAAIAEFPRAEPHLRACVRASEDPLRFAATLLLREEGPGPTWPRLRVTIAPDLRVLRNFLGDDPAVRRDMVEDEGIIVESRRCGGARLLVKVVETRAYGTQIEFVLDASGPMPVIAASEFHRSCMSPTEITHPAGEILLPRATLSGTGERWLEVLWRLDSGPAGGTVIPLPADF